MNKIDEIKLYDDSYWQHYLREHTIFDVDNIKSQKDWLISKLEMTQKALEGVVNVIHVQRVTRDIGNQSQWDEALLCKAQEALGRLKE